MEKGKRICEALKAFGNVLQKPTTSRLKWKNVRTKGIAQAHVPNANLNCAI